MKKLRLTVILVTILSISGYSQIFNTGQTLKRKHFRLGIEPTIYVNNSSDFLMFLHGGMHLTRKIDFNLKAGFNNGNTYIGGEIEYALSHYISISFGAHNYNNFGLDGLIMLTYPITKSVFLSSGFDSDYNFIKPNDDEDLKTQFLGWLPINIEIGIRRNLAFVLETEIALTSPAYNIIGGGVNIYF